MIDLHTHLLPGVDDGVRDDDEAVDFARLAVRDGVEVVVATPHCREGVWPMDRETMLARVERLRRRLAGEGVDLRVEPGAEVHICPDLPQRIRDGRAPTLADNGKTLLLELSLTQYPVELENLVFQLRLAGVETIFAHPERIRYFQEDVRRYESVIRLGAYGQITTGSILGRVGGETREFSEELLRKGLVHVLASDGHNLRGRSPRLSPALEATAGLIGEERARRMVDEFPRALLDGKPPEIPPVEETPLRRRSWISRLLGRS